MITVFLRYFVLPGLATLFVVSATGLADWMATADRVAFCGGVMIMAFGVSSEIEKRIASK